MRGVLKIYTSSEICLYLFESSRTLRLSTADLTNRAPMEEKDFFRPLSDNFGKIMALSIAI